MKKVLISFLILGSLSAFASVIKVDCKTNEITTSGDYFSVSAEVSSDYELDNVIFKTNAYTSKESDIVDPWGSRDLSVGSYTNYRAYKDDLYALALYLPAYKATYENRESIIGQISINDFQNEIFGKTYEMTCTLSNI